MRDEGTPAYRDVPARDGAQLRIGEVARLVGVSPSTIRAWEREGLVAAVRGPGRQRLFHRSDVERLRDARRLRESGYGHRVVRHVLSDKESRATGAAHAGARLRAIRVRHGLSLRRVAAALDLSIAYLSLIERGLATPTVALLQRLTAAYGGTVREVFEDDLDTSPPVKLVRPDERKRLSGFDRVLMEDLVRFPQATLQVEIFTIEPGGGSGGRYAHTGEEVLFVLEGQLQIWLDEQECYDLEVGDTLYFPSTQQHRWHNPGTMPTRIFWVNTPPTF